LLVNDLDDGDETDSNVRNITSLVRLVTIMYVCVFHYNNLYYCSDFEWTDELQPVYINDFKESTGPTVAVLRYNDNNGLSSAPLTQ
jgi:hypothetical protein